MSNDVHEAAQRLLTTINGIHVGVQVQPGKIISTADVIRVCQWALPLLDRGEVTEEWLRSEGFLPMTILDRMEKPLGNRWIYFDMPSSVGITNDSHATGKSFAYNITTRGQLRLLLAALSANPAPSGKEGE